VAWQASEANAARRLYVTVSETNTSCHADGAGNAYFGYARGVDTFTNPVCTVAATGGTAFTDSNQPVGGLCAAAITHQPQLVTQGNGATNPVVVSGCNGGIQASWTTAQSMTCTVPSSANCSGGSTWQVISQGKN
jgi:hypothetical protein